MLVSLRERQGTTFGFTNTMIIMRKKITGLLFIVLTLCCSCQNTRQGEVQTGKDIDYNYLKSHFQKPERIYGVNCWWWWLNGNVTKEAITRDLEAMKSKNFQGAMIFDAGGHNQRGNKDIPEGPEFGSKEWNELFVYALDEAKRVGLEVGFNIQSGWNLGGPCVTPQYAAKQLTYTELKVSGGKVITQQMPDPLIRKGFYEDIVVLAFPIDETLQTDEGIESLDLKLGFHELGGSAPDCRFLLTNTSYQATQETGRTFYRIERSNIIDLTAQMDKKGLLTCDIPPGEWCIMRIGYTCTNSEVSTSSNSWQGNVLDYMSKEAFDFYWNNVVEPIFNLAGDHVGTTLKFLETDSWECGGMNWTDNFVDEFCSYRGYDLLTYLPVIAGYVVDDIDTSNAFLADFRKTLGELVAHNHYAQFAEHAHHYNMGIQPESAGPHAGPMDGIKNYGFSDIVMSEFWSPSPHRPRARDRFFLKQASSAAHIYGKKIVGAESFTTIGPQWNDELWSEQKPSFDHEICSGLNRVYFHTFTCSPAEMGLPGQEYFAGTHINPQVTWWEKSDALIDYIQRIQMLVQNGRFVADVLYYYGDHVPNVFPFKDWDPAGVMPGFDYDVTDETIFTQLKVVNGEIVVPGGISYRVLVLPNHRVLSLTVLEKVKDLLEQGAHIIGYKPDKMISLTGGTSAQEHFKELSDDIWGTSEEESGERKYGKGKIIWGVSAKNYLFSLNIPADFSIWENKNETDYDYIHYTVGTTHMYFISNQTGECRNIMAQFRLSGFQPELWDALTGETREAKAFNQKEGSTTVPLSLEPYGSIFVIFNRAIDKNTQGKGISNYPEYETLQEISGPWIVNFNSQRGAPASISFPELTDWTTNTNENIKYYSGSAVYNKTFNVSFSKEKDISYFLQLENVKDVGIASVQLNGKDKGILWTKPFRVNITNELQEGENSLEIEVINSWYNRVAGDEMGQGRKKYTNTNIVLGHDFAGRTIQQIPLEPSGLLGPVTIRKGILE